MPHHPSMNRMLLFGSVRLSIVLPCQDGLIQEAGERAQLIAMSLREILVTAVPMAVFLVCIDIACGLL